MREFRSSGSVRGVLSNGHPYRDAVQNLALRANGSGTLCCSTDWGRQSERSEAFWHLMLSVPGVD
ncbi:hypothetical protein EN795_37735, partial [bacterium M00.F.Ca.ET.152.01.1.1]